MFTIQVTPAFGCACVLLNRTAMSDVPSSVMVNEMNLDLALLSKEMYTIMVRKASKVM